MTEQPRDQALTRIQLEAGEVLATHSIKTGIRDGRVHCWCGWVADRGRAPGFYTPHCIHQVEELEKAGLLVRRKRSAPRPEPE